MQFEEALRRLEEIVSELESGELTLDAALSRFEEGVKLTRFCAEKLRAVEQRIKILSEDELGNIVEEDFAPEERGAHTEGPNARAEAGKAEAGDGSPEGEKDDDERLLF